MCTVDFLWVSSGLFFHLLLFTGLLCYKINFTKFPFLTVTFFSWLLPSPLVFSNKIWCLPPYFKLSHKRMLSLQLVDFFNVILQKVISKLLINFPILLCVEGTKCSYSTSYLSTVHWTSEYKFLDFGYYLSLFSSCFYQMIKRIIAEKSK